MLEYRIYIDDFRKKSYCVKGIKPWFAMNNLDFADFLENGIDPQKLIDTKDIRAIDIVESKYGKKETNN